MLETVLASSMAKIRMSGLPARYAEIDCVEGIRGETLSFQLAYRAVGEGIQGFITLSVSPDLQNALTVRETMQCPVRLAAYEGVDDDYLGKEPGLYPDLLAPCDKKLRPARSYWQSVWIDCDPALLPQGDTEITLTLSDCEGSALAQRKLTLRVWPGELPRQTLIHTKWFHADSLSAYYGVPVFSDAHFAICEKFIRRMVKLGINMLYTPIHTPPLDTDIGAERRTAQLTDIEKKGEKYSFSFDKLDRYVRIAKDAGIEYFEMAHLFTQWGATSAPKIVATENGAEKRVFGWDTPATGKAYSAFLSQYLPALTERLRKLHIADKCVFHISDEPSEASLKQYLACKALVEPYLKDFTIMDALSEPSFYDQGVSRHPVPANTHIAPFLERKVPGLWTYYCCGQSDKVSNLFVAMPGERTRILGVQLYLYEIAGFLQWGYNYYFAQNSRYPIDPYRVLDGDGAWPAGDPFQVYPGKDGEPYDSIRAMQVKQALDDLRAFRYLESLAGRDFVLSLINEDLHYTITFDAYPRDEKWLSGLRGRVNAAIAARLRGEA